MFMNLKILRLDDNGTQTLGQAIFRAKQLDVLDELERNSADHELLFKELNGLN